MARRLIREEGLLVGGSAGAAMAGAMKAAKNMPPGSRVVVVLADSIRNYMTKHLSDVWMADRGFVDAARKIGVYDGVSPGVWWSGRTVGDLPLSAPVSVTPAVSCSEAVELMKSCGFDQLPVCGEDGAIVGVLTESSLTGRLTKGRVRGSDPITKAMFAQFAKVQTGTPLPELARILDRDAYALVVASQKVVRGGGSVSEKSVVVGVLTRIDLLEYLTRHAPVDDASSPRFAGQASPARAPAPSSF